MTQEILLIALGALGGSILLWMFTRRDNSGATIHDSINKRLDSIMQQVDRRLQENVHAMNESKSFLADRVSSTERTVREVTSTLSKLEHATTSLKASTDEISSFQNLLKSPKVRGSFGEVLLANLLADVLPTDRYQLQYAMPSTRDIADAVIRLQDGYIVAVDAKFPLANYEIYAREHDPTRKAGLRTQVQRDMKKHISDISGKYISPADKTLDYAFMYIPVEGVYYETMVHSDQADELKSGGSGLWDFCLQHHVVPVSPNSFLAYLQTILVGLRGMKIEQQAKEILQHLGQVRKDFSQFGEDFAMIGKHLLNAKNRYDSSARRLDKFNNRLEQIEGDTPPQLED